MPRSQDVRLLELLGGQLHERTVGGRGVQRAVPGTLSRLEHVVSASAQSLTQPIEQHREASLEEPVEVEVEGTDASRHSGERRKTARRSE